MGFFHAAGFVLHEAGPEIPLQVDHLAGHVLLLLDLLGSELLGDDGFEQFDLGGVVLRPCLQVELLPVQLDHPVGQVLQGYGLVEGLSGFSPR